MSVSEGLAETARVMLGDLEERRLRVVLIFPYWEIGNEGGLRRVEEQNPRWYREFCAYHSPSRRTPRPRRRKKPDTYIKRAHTLRALREIAAGRADSIYAQRLLPYVQQVHDALGEHNGWMIE